MFNNCYSYSSFSCSFQDLFNGKNISAQDLGINEISKIFQRAGVDYTKLDINENGWDISSLDPTDLDSIKNAWHNYYEELVAEAQTAKDELANANSEMSSEMMYWVQSLPQYTGSDSDLQIAMMNMVNGIDWTSIEPVDGSAYEGAKSEIQKLVLTPLNQIADNPAAQKQFSSAISGLFALNTTDMPAEQAREIITNYIQQIMDLLNQFGYTDNKLSLDEVYSMFGFSDFNDNAAAFSNSLSKIAGSSTSDINKGQKITDKHLSGTKVMLPELYIEKQS